MSALRMTLSMEMGMTLPMEIGMTLPVEMGMTLPMEIGVFSSIALQAAVRLPSRSGAGIAE